MGGERTLLHRTLCTEPDAHVAPIGSDTNEPDFEYHGESNHPAAVGEQCMCGHPSFLTCPDEWSFWEKSVACTVQRHSLCDGAGWQRYVGEFQAGTCPCDCHSCAAVVS